MMIETTQMTATVVTYPANVQQKIDELVAENFYIDDIVEFIDEHGNDDFLNHYDTYVELGEDYNYGAVDAFIEEFGIDLLSVDNFQDSYEGQYDSEAQFAEEHYDAMGYEIPPFVVVDWQATWDQFLNHCCTFSNGYVFKTNW